MIAIDGPSGAGKSTAGKTLALRLGYTFVDTGAMYRALALRALESGVPLSDQARLAELAGSVRIELVDGGRGVVLDGETVTARLRTREVSVAASVVSAHPGVRRAMVARQREMGLSGGVVLDGRDIGTAVFPDAELKFYVDAEPARRAERRHEELLAAGVDSDVVAIEREIRARDHADMTRTDSPLTRAGDAIHIDTTALTQDQVVQRMLDCVRAASA